MKDGRPTGRPFYNSGRRSPSRRQWSPVSAVELRRPSNGCTVIYTNDLPFIHLVVLSSEEEVESEDDSGRVGVSRPVEVGVKLHINTSRDALVLIFEFFLIFPKYPKCIEDYVHKM